MKINALFTSAVLLLLAACAEDTPVDTGRGSGIVFGISEAVMSRGEASSVAGHFDLCNNTDTVAVRCTVEDMALVKAAGRGEPATGIGNFRAWAYLHDGGTVKPFFSGEPVSDKGSYWSTDQTYYWPTSATQRLAFTALSVLPDGMTVDARQQGVSIQYTIASQAAAQPDVMLAETEPVNGNGIPDYRVPLRFKHICAAVCFKTGNQLMPGTIEKITLSGIHDTGTYADGAWSIAGNVRSFSLDTSVETTGNETAGSDLYQPYNTFMFLPQVLGPDARLEVVFNDKTSGTTRTLSASLAGQEWPMGRITTYHIGISPDFGLEFNVAPPVQDAHYVMCNTSISVRGVGANTGWTLTAVADDGADVSIQREADANEFAKQGYWLDKRMSNGVVQNESVRGTSMISGVGNVENLDVRVFIPENAGDGERGITLTLHVDGTPVSTAVTQTITQLHPAWNGSAGWEQIDDNESGIYGFCYTARHVYVYNNTHPDVWPFYTASKIIDQVTDMVTNYNAGNYTEVIKYWWKTGYRNYVDIDYRKLNTLDNKSKSTTDGLRNTRDLVTFGGTALSKNFEKAIKEMRRVTDTSVLAYSPKNERNPNDDPSSMPDWIDGTEINESQSLALVLKKNRYFLNTSTVEGSASTTPLIRPEDIEWYMPASGQFAGMPGWYGGAAATPGDYWSSTAATGTNSYIGNGMALPRTTVKNIRVMRNRP